MSEVSWVPHRRETWPWRFGLLRKAVTLREWVGHKCNERGEPIMVPRDIPAGTKVKIVMVSRFGDVGITDDLDAENGYGARIELDDMEPVQ